MAPEILSYTPNYTVKVDMWALGIIYHQLLYGKMPFKKLTANMFELKETLDKFTWECPSKPKISLES